MSALSSQAETDLRAFEALVNSWPQVRECHMLAGETGLPAQGRGRGLGRATRPFSPPGSPTAPNVSHVKSSLAIRTAKFLPGVPVEAD
jgi:hypothetical protein